MNLIWTERMKVSNGLRNALVRTLGISEVDIRDIQMAFNYDVYRVRLWNHRKIMVSGFDIFRSMK